MRTAVLRNISRLIGIGLILCAVVLVVILMSVLQEEGWRGSGWASPIIVAMIIGLLLAGRHYFRMNPDAPEEPRPWTPFSILLVQHRHQLHQLQVLALTGLGLTLFYLVAVFLGTQARWPLWPLGMGALVLRFLGRKIANSEITGNRDWQNVPAWLREILPQAQKIVDTALLLAVLLMGWNSLHPVSAPKVPGLRFAFQLVMDMEIALLYALEALFFEYGELRTHSPG